MINPAQNWKSGPITVPERTISYSKVPTRSVDHYKPAHVGLLGRIRGPSKLAAILVLSGLAVFSALFSPQLIGRVLGVQVQGGSAVTLDRVLDDDFNLSLGGYLEGSMLKATTTSGAPLTVSSSSLVANLNSDLLDALDSSQFLRSDTSDAFTSGTLTFNAGTTLDISLATLALASNQIAWDRVSKTGSSLADLITRSAADLTSGILPSARLSGSYTGITGVGTLTSGTWNAIALTDTYISDTLTIGALSLVADAALSANVSLLNTAQTFTANKTFDASSTLYFAGGTTYYLNNAGSAYLDDLTSVGTLSFPSDSITDLMIPNTITASNYLLLTGGTLTGTLIVSGVSGLTDADIPNDITASNYLQLTGGTLSGALTVSDIVTAESFQKSCSSGWLFVPGNPKYGTMPGFCVMKYEAKDVSSTATSQAASTPWTSISQETSRDECRELGNGYHLITEAEWMTIAENVIRVDSNWSSGTAESGCLYGGHSDNNPNNALAADVTGDPDDDPYVGTSDASTDTFQCPFDMVVEGSGVDGKEQRRTFTLTNNNVIWDFSGNVWEWTDMIMNIDDMPEDGSPASEWLEYTAVIKYKALNYVRPPDGAWNVNTGVGRIYTDVGDTSGSIRGFIRSGYWGGGANSGAFTLYLQLAPSPGGAGNGFRCAASL